MNLAPHTRAHKYMHPRTGLHVFQAADLLRKKDRKKEGLMDEFPPQSDHVCDELFGKVKSKQTAGETPNLRQIRRKEG